MRTVEGMGCSGVCEESSRCDTIYRHHDECFSFLLKVADMPTVWI